VCAPSRNRRAASATAACCVRFSINGGPSGLNSFNLDGVANNNPRAGDLNVNPGVDAVEEFKVQSGVMAAEFGYTAGAW